MNIIKKFNLILVYSIPFFLIFFHSIADAIVIFTGLIFFILLLLNKFSFTLRSLINDKVIISFFLFYIILLFSSFLSEFQSLSLKRSIPYIRFIFFIVALKYWLFVDKSSIKIMSYCIAACVLFVSFDIMFQYLNYSYVLEQSFLNRFDYKSELLFLDLVTNSSSIELIKNEFDLFKYPYGSDYIFQGPFGLDYVKKGFDIFQYPSKNYYRFQGPFGDEFIAGGFILRFSPFLLLVVLGICRQKKNIFFKSLIIFSVILIFVPIFITGDRAPFFILILVSSLLILLFFEKKYILILTSILIFIIFILSISSDQKKKRYINEVLVSIGYQNNEFTLDTGYGHLFYSAIKIWIDKPLLGAGTKNYRKICSRPEFNFETKYNIELCSTHPHNYVLELLSEVGLMGIISFYLIFFYLLRELESIKKLLKKNLDDLNVRFAILSLIFILWPLSTTGSIITNFNSIVLWLVFGLAYSSISITKKSYLI